MPNAQTNSSRLEPTGLGPLTLQTVPEKVLISSSGLISHNKYAGILPVTDLAYAKLSTRARTK